MPTIPKRRAVVWVLCAVLILLALAQDQNGADVFVSRMVRVSHGRPGLDDAKILGAGIFLGNGLILTAAHVAGPADSAFPLIVSAGHWYWQARIVTQGALERIDIALLAIDPQAVPKAMQAMAALTLCRQPTVPGQQVAVAAPWSARVTRILSPTAIPEPLRGRYATLLDQPEKIGNSGAGVFDLRKGCLLGVVSQQVQRPEERDGVWRNVAIAKYFVSAQDIAALIGPIMAEEGERD